MEATITKDKVCLEGILEQNGIYLYDEGCTPEVTYRFLQIAIIADKIERKIDFKKHFTNLFDTSYDYNQFKTSIEIIEDSVPLPFLYFASKKMIEYLVSIGCEVTKDDDQDEELTFLIFNTIQEFIDRAEEYMGYEKENVS